MSQSSLSKQPSFMRYARVQTVLEQEAAFVAKMGSRTETVFKPDGEKQLFSPEVIAVTQAIHSAGKDAHKVHKTEIVRIACQVFRIGRSAAAPAPNGAAVITTPAKPDPEPAPITPEVVLKPAKVVSKSPAKAKQKAKQAIAKAPATAPAPEPPKEEPTIKPPAQTAEVDSREEALAKAKELLNPERPGENPAAFNAYISMYSMTLTVLQLVEIYDNQPGKEKRFKTLDDLAKEFNKFTSIKSAKEANKS